MCTYRFGAVAKAIIERHLWANSTAGWCNKDDESFMLDSMMNNRWTCMAYRNRTFHNLSISSVMNIRIICNPTIHFKMVLYWYYRIIQTYWSGLIVYWEIANSRCRVLYFFNSTILPLSSSSSLYIWYTIQNVFVYTLLTIFS